MSRAIRNSFRALEVLNHCDALRLSEISKALGLPRTTTVRAIRALEEMGYVERRDGDTRYCLTQRVLGLGGGYGETHELVAALRPGMDALSADTGWPISLALPFGLGLRIYYTTDAQARRKIFTSTAGLDLPVRATATGLVYLAFTDAESRRLMLDAEPPDTAAFRTRSDAEVEAALDGVRRRGWYLQEHSFVRSALFEGFQEKESVLAVPVVSGDHAVGVLAARLLTRAVSRDWIERSLAPRLTALAAAAGGERGVAQAASLAGGARPQPARRTPPRPRAAAAPETR